MAQVSSSPFTSSGEWDGCNYLSLKIIRVCLLEPERRSGAHGTAEEWIKKKERKKKGSIGEKKYGMMGEGRMNRGLEPRVSSLVLPSESLNSTKGNKLSF